MSRRLHALHVGNFKAFADTQRIPLKPITLVFGPNSSGKSSFIHSLALAHEAQFGRDKQGRARLDVHHTEVGGNAIDLGGFRQFVHRGQLAKRVEWGAELKLSELREEKKFRQLGQLLQSVRTIRLNVFLGIELDDYDRPKPGAEPRVEAVEILADGEELLRMSRRGNEHGGSFRLDRLASAHSVFRQLAAAIVESSTTSPEMRAEDVEGVDAAIADLLPQLQVRVEQFLPSGVDLPNVDGTDNSPTQMLFALSKGNRQEDLAQAVRFVLPRSLNDLVKGISEIFAEELKRLQYLGPLRSFPPRHLAFAETEDANWYAGGGYAWDVVRRSDVVREKVNGWLGSDKLKTPYELVVRSLMAVDNLQQPIEAGLEELGSEGLSIQHDPPEDVYPIIEDAALLAESVVRAIEESNIDRVRELVLLDKRSNTVVTHRDVGIGISQVLPVLVMAYASHGKLLAMEQPEIHLHPALQAELGDVFIESALGERKNTFILETHSEHLILRLMRRMRETFNGTNTSIMPVTPSDIAVLYVEPDGTRSIVREMPLNELGELVKSWPGGFFEEGLREQFGDA
jgi:predicted ATPase